MKKLFHNDPHFTIKEQTLLTQFLRVAQIDPPLDSEELTLAKLCAAFSRIPYENLTKILKSDDGLGPAYAKRLPDEVLRDYLHFGTGGTCFSLTAAYIAVFNALGIEAHPILADRHYGTETHCALIFSNAGQIALLDPGFQMYQPTRLPTTEALTIATQFNTLELCPHEAGRRVDLATNADNNRRVRLTYTVQPVDGPTFGRAWERSFTWEMMTYPVLTRYRDGRHYYLQGDVLRVRDPQRTTRSKLSPDERFRFMTDTLGIHKDICNKVFSG